MKIVKLKAENIKKLVAVEITPAGNLVKITGKNAAGKTSVLDAIYWALAGGENIQEQPIRQGEDHATVELDLGEMVVRRTFNSKDGGATTALTIENKDGLRFKSPQTLLDGLLGRLSFDPLEFMRQEPRRQIETLRTLTGVDLSKLDAMRQKVYDERTEVNREVNRLNVQVEAARVPPGAPTAEVSANDVIEQIKLATERVKEKEKFQAQARALNEEIDTYQKEVEKYRADIASVELLIARTREAIKTKEQSIADVAILVNEAIARAEVVVIPDIQALQVELGTIEEKNKAARAYLAREELRKEAGYRKGYSDGLTQKIEEIDLQKANMIAAAKFPLEGLGFGDGVVTYNGLPLSQASHAEQLRVSVAIAMQLNPKLRVLRATDGSLLDSNSMKILADMCNDRDYQLWIEVCSDDEKVGIVIEGGQVLVDNYQKKEVTEQTSDS